jgi:hypothetical protein
MWLGRSVQVEFGLTVLCNVTLVDKDEGVKVGEAALRAGVNYIRYTVTDNTGDTISAEMSVTVSMYEGTQTGSNIKTDVLYYNQWASP